MKYLGGGIAASSALLAACKDDERRTTAALQEPPKDKMTYRTNPNTGDKVSLLGYGMMRLPVVSGSGQDNQDAPYDQEMVNRQVDYAIGTISTHRLLIVEENQRPSRVSLWLDTNVKSFSLPQKCRTSVPTPKREKGRFRCLKTRSRTCK